MILIGLFGGSSERRDTITRALTQADSANIGCYQLSDTEAMDGPARAEKLAVALQGLNDKVQGSTLIVSHVLSVEEAAAIRARGGSMWYVQGEPSEVIAIQKGDLAVTAFAGGCRHFLDAKEAYSEVLLAHGRLR